MSLAIWTVADALGRLEQEDEQTQVVAATGRYTGHTLRYTGHTIRYTGQTLRYTGHNQIYRPHNQIHRPNNSHYMHIANAHCTCMHTEHTMCI